MKKISVFLTVMMVFMIGSAPMSAKKNEVVLDASEVTSAADIESAIDLATKSGTRLGIVTLDSSKGDFVYTEADRSIDMRISNVLLRSRNGATIRNCENGVFFDSTPVKWVIIQGITFNCELSGVVAWSGAHVVIHDNTFHVRAYGVYIQGGKDWTITGNHAEAPGGGIYLLDSWNVKVHANHLTGDSGVVLDQSQKVWVAKNEIHATSYGIILGPSASTNWIVGNRVMSTQYAGFTFKGGNENNRVLSNKIQCTWSYACELYTVDETYTPLSPTNKIANNTLIPAEESNTFTTKLLPGVWSTFKPGLSSSGSVYLADVTPLHESVDGAHIEWVIEPAYDGEQWNDVLRVMIPAEAPSQDVQITVYELNGLQTIMDVTDGLVPGRRRSDPIARPMDYFPTAYFADLDPLDASVDWMRLERYLIHPEFLEGEWMDTLLIQTPPRIEPDPFNLRMRVYTADQLYIVSDFNVTLTKNDTWIGFAIGPSSLERGYVVRAFPLNGDTQADLDHYTVQPEFGGNQWNDILRIRMGNLNGDWESIEYNFKVYACDNTVCP